MLGYNSLFDGSYLGNFPYADMLPFPHASLLLAISYISKAFLITLKKLED